MITILLSKIRDLLIELKTNIENIKTTSIDYSTDEKEIGIWLDGSKLYEKTLKFNNVYVTNDPETSELLHGISNFKKGFIVESYNDFDGGENWKPCLNNIAGVNTNYVLQWGINSTNIYLNESGLQFSASENRSYLFKIRYTKNET